MAQAGYTPIQLYYSTTAAAVPLAANLAQGELAINIADGKLYYENSSGVVTLLAGAGGAGIVAGSNTQLQFNNSGVFGASANLTWDGTTLSSTQVNITGQGTLRLQDTTGGEYVGLRSPSALGASYTLTFPADDGTSGQALITDGSGVLSWSTAASGDVYGPASATDNALARFDLTTGKLIQNSVGILSDTGALSGLTDISASGSVTLTGGTAAGVLYLNGSKVVTSGAALSFNGTTLTIDAGATTQAAEFRSSAANGVYMSFINTSTAIGDIGASASMYSGGSAGDFGINSRSGSLTFSQNSTYRGRFDTSGNLLVNLATALANGKLQVAGSIGLSGNTEIRQATNSDGNTLRLLATQVVVGATNAISYGYAGSALLASFSNAASATVLEVGGNTAGHRLTVTNDSTGQSGNLNYTNVGGSRFYVNSLTGYAGFGTSSPTDQVQITTVDGGNTAAKLRLVGSNAGGIINFYNTTFPTGQFNFDQSGNFTLSQSLLYATSTIYPTLTIDTSQQLFMKANVTGFTDIKALRASAFGYSPSSYGALIIGATPGTNVTPCINVDPAANTGGSFSGTGGEVMFRNGVGFIQPNSANTNFNPILTFDTAGNGFYVTKSIGIGGTSPTSTGTGITFPATQSASSDANTLDDYEEGYWFPVLTPASGTITVTGGNSKGAYTKVGRLVTVTGDAAYTSSAASGEITLSGLPFAVNTSLDETSERFSGGVMLSGFTTGDGYGVLACDSGTSGTLRTSILTNPVPDASFEIYISFSYFTT